MKNEDLYKTIEERRALLHISIEAAQAKIVEARAEIRGWKQELETLPRPPIKRAPRVRKSDAPVITETENGTHISLTGHGSLVSAGQ